MSSAWPLAAQARQPRARVIGFLWPGTAPPASPRMKSFRQGLQSCFGSIVFEQFRPHGRTSIVIQAFSYRSLLTISSI